jgi:hypothetical protein
MFKQIEKHLKKEANTKEKGIIDQSPAYVIPLQYA